MREFGFHEDDESEPSAASEKAKPGRRGSDAPDKRKASTAGMRVDEKGDEKGALMKAEGREVGLVSVAMYFKLASVAGWHWALGIVACAVLAAACKVAGDWWLSVWTSTLENMLAVERM